MPIRSAAQHLRRAILQVGCISVDRALSVLRGETCCQSERIQGWASRGIQNQAARAGMKAKWKNLIRNIKNLLQSFFSRSTFAPVQGLRAQPLSRAREQKGAGSLWACFLALAGCVKDPARWCTRLIYSLYTPLPATRSPGNCCSIVTNEQQAKEAVCTECLRGYAPGALCF